MTSSHFPINLIFADDHELYRDGFTVMIKKIKEIKLLGGATNGKELIHLARRVHPDVIITDINMPELGGIEVTKQLTQEMPDIKIIALSMYDEANIIIEMLEAGAKGYLLKNAPKLEVAEAVKAVYEGKSYYSNDIDMRMIKRIASSSYNPFPNIKAEFTDQQIEVIKLIYKELSNKEIAEQLNIDKRTVDWHIQNILEKINARNRVGIVIYALKSKLICLA